MVPERALHCLQIGKRHIDRNIHALRKQRTAHCHILRKLGRTREIQVHLPIPTHKRPTNRRRKVKSSRLVHSRRVLTGVRRMQLGDRVRWKRALDRQAKITVLADVGEMCLSPIGTRALDRQAKITVLADGGEMCLSPFGALDRQALACLSTVGSNWCIGQASLGLPVHDWL